MIHKLPALLLLLPLACATATLPDGTRVLVVGSGSYQTEEVVVESKGFSDNFTEGFGRMLESALAWFGRSVATPSSDSE